MNFENQQANNTEKYPPFKAELKKIKTGDDFDIHKLEQPESVLSLPGGQESDWQNEQYIITEYSSKGKRDHQSFLGLKNFYEEAKKELGDILPASFFVEGEPSNPQNADRSFYVVQNFADSDFRETAKKIDELNSNEFSVEFLNALLRIQEKLSAFLEKHSDSLDENWNETKDIDPKLFKEGIMYNPKNSQIQIANFFKLDPETAKMAFDNSQEFSASQDRLKSLKMLGLAALVKKINWVIERSALPEWLKGEKIHWKLNPEKIKAIEDKGQKAMALTFDDGPNEETEKLLDILKEEKVKATFFLVGSQIAGREHIVKRIIDEGHEVGVHEWAQEGLPTPQALKNPNEYAKRFVGPRQDLGDVKRCKELIKNVSDKEPTIGRMAGVHGTVDSLREFQAMNLDIIHADPYDILFIPPSKKLPAEKLLKRALKNNGHGKIRLFHIGTMTDSGQPLDKSEINFDKGEVYPPEETLKMIRDYIETSKKQNYVFVGIEESI